jgi:DGQHR domain-containing protein
MTVINLQQAGGNSMYLPSGYAEFALRYKQGKRTMYVMVPNPFRLADMAKNVTVYDPRSEAEDFSNRLQNKPHIKGISEYLQSTPDRWILGAMVVYVKPDTVTFVPIAERPDKAMGILDLPEGTPFFAIGDGQHRAEGYKGAFSRHPDPDDPVRKALLESSQPVIVVEEPSPLQASMDFVDLATTKPIPSSLRAALDKRKAINRLCLDLAQAVPMFDQGERIEFLRASVSKNGKKVFAFASLKFAVATMLVGFSQRSTAGLETATETALSQDYDGLYKRTLADLTLLSEKLPGWREVTDGSMEPSVAKELYVSCTSAGLNAIAGTLFDLHQGGGSSADAIDKMAKLDWRKTNWVQDPSAKDVNDVFFEGTVLQDGNIVSNRPSFEAAAKSLSAAVNN